MTTLSGIFKQIERIGTLNHSDLVIKILDNYDYIDGYGFDTAGMTCKDVDKFLNDCSYLDETDWGIYYIHKDGKNISDFKIQCRG
jgi:hypothetical protein